MRKQVQFNGLWQSTATGVIRYADTEHGVLWERTLEETREVWRQLPVSKSHLRGYLQAQSENGWQMVSANRDEAREPEAFAAWHGDMFPHGVPLRVSEYSCDVKHAVMAACETDAANGWIVDARGAVHALTPEEREMIRLTMAMDAMNDSWELDAADVVEPDMGEPEPEPVETLEPATVEEDTRDVSEIIAEANKKYLGGKGVLYRVPAYHDAIVYVTPSNRWVGYSIADGYEQWDHDPRAAAELPWDKTLQELEAAGLIVQCFEELDIPPYVTAYEFDDYEQSLEVSRLTEEAGWEFDGGMIMRPVASADTTETVIVEPVEVEHDGVVDVELAETSETIPVVEAKPAVAEPEPAEPRSVESAPTLPAECSAETQEIPEVPPQVNNQARVLKVSEHVIPTGQKVAGGEMFPDVSYRSVHAFTVAVRDDAGNVVKRKKVAYAFRHHGMVHVVRRDRYERAGRDATVEAEITAFVAKLQKAA